MDTEDETVEIALTEFCADLEKIKTQITQIQSGFDELKVIVSESVGADDLLADLTARQSFLQERERYISEKEEQLIASISDVEVVNAEIENIEEGL